MTKKTPEELYRQGREVLEELAPMVKGEGMGQKFAELVDLVDLLKPQEAPEKPVEIPSALRGKHASTAWGILKVRFRRALGVNIFNNSHEDMVRDTWTLVRAIIVDKNAELEEQYANSGIHDTPDWDAVTDLLERTEIPEDLTDLLWGLRPKAPKIRKGR